MRSAVRFDPTKRGVDQERRKFAAAMRRKHGQQADLEESGVHRERKRFTREVFVDRIGRRSAGRDAHEAGDLARDACDDREDPSVERIVKRLGGVRRMLSEFACVDGVSQASDLRLVSRACDLENDLPSLSRHGAANRRDLAEGLRMRQASRLRFQGSRALRAIGPHRLSRARRVGQGPRPAWKKTCRMRCGIR